MKQVQIYDRYFKMIIMILLNNFEQFNGFLISLIEMGIFVKCKVYRINHILNHMGSFAVMVRRPLVCALGISIVLCMNTKEQARTSQQRRPMHYMALRTNGYVLQCERTVGKAACF